MPKVYNDTRNHKLTDAPAFGGCTENVSPDTPVFPPTAMSSSPVMKPRLIITPSSYSPSRNGVRKVYTDEGISGTNTKRREGFKEMITDALDGKIDLIITKSVSRFARNTVDSLVTIRKLKKKNGVECYFEKEGIYTFDGKGELLITIMSLAQYSCQPTPS